MSIDRDPFDPSEHDVQRLFHEITCPPLYDQDAPENLVPIGDASDQGELSNEEVMSVAEFNYRAKLFLERGIVHFFDDLNGDPPLEA